jgi:5-methylcytosine-specific restriction enzyme B
VTLMPDREAVVSEAPAIGVEFFDRLADVFIQHASDDMLDLLPGHAYYLARNEDEFKKRMRYDLLPLLDEYLRQGLLGAMASELHSVRDEIDDYANRV